VDSVLPQSFQTPRRELKIRLPAEYFFDKMVVWECAVTLFLDSPGDKNYLNLLGK